MNTEPQSQTTSLTPMSQAASSRILFSIETAVYNNYLPYRLGLGANETAANNEEVEENQNWSLIHVCYLQ